MNEFGSGNLRPRWGLWTTPAPTRYEKIFLVPYSSTDVGHDVRCGSWNVELGRGLGHDTFWQQRKGTPRGAAPADRGTPSATRHAATGSAATPAARRRRQRRAGHQRA